MNETLQAARGGDQEAFSQLTEPHRHELLVHCYRMLGSLLDAEDMVQETFLRAWRRLETYEERASLRAWLYKIATNACLDALEKQRQPRSLPPAELPASENPLPDLNPLPEYLWLQPLPDDLLSDHAVDPEAAYTLRESVTLAFLTVLQKLSPRQRAILILRDVLNWRAKEVADHLDLTELAVNSALLRARTSLQAENFQPSTPPQDLDRLLNQYVQAWETADVSQLVALLREDAIFTMPPLPSWYAGRVMIAKLLAESLFAGQAVGRWQMQPVGANGQPAFINLRRDDASGQYSPFNLMVLTIVENQIARIDAFFDPRLLQRFQK